MGVVKAVRIARRIKRFERARGMKVSQQLEALEDPHFFDRVRQSQEIGGFVAELVSGTPVEPKPFVHTFKPLTVRQYNQIIYSKRRDIIQ